MNRALLPAAALSAALVLAPNVGAQADAPAARAAKTSIKIQTFDVGMQTVTFKGTVRSPRKSCVQGRKVVLRQIDEGTTVGTDRVSRNGTWSIRFNQDEAGPGRFRATVLRTAGCRADSDTFAVEGAPERF